MVRRVINIWFIFFVFLFVLPFPCYADLDSDITKLGEQIAQIDAALSPLKKESSDLTKKINVAKSQIALAEKQIEALTADIEEKAAELANQKTLLGERARRYYINSRKFDPLMIFLASNESSSLIRQYNWYQSIIAKDRDLIMTYTNDLSVLNQNKANLEAQKIKLAGLKKSLESRFGFLAGEIQKAEDYKAELTAKQQALIAEKTAVFNTAVGDVSTADDPAARADFNPGFSPAYAVFSFGAPHRKGMSQYGAFGRAKAGQNYETILKAYYGDIRLEKIDVPGSIKTSIGTLPFEDNYLIGIAEMPAKWGELGGMEALKAQAIAARTYALNYTNMGSGSSICVTETCQVYSRSRYNSPGKWKEAVETTRGLVIKANSTGRIFSTMYASTAGGYTYGYSSSDYATPSVWDTTCGSQGCWPGDAYEKAAGSPWFYKGWYKTRSGTSCGRSHPWLTKDEFADIINANIYFKNTHDSSHLSQYNSGGCFGGNDPNAWGMEELRRQVGDKGGPVSSIDSISVDYSTGGFTKTVHIVTDKGSFDFDGGDFKQVYNLRAPGAIAVKSSLFNIEKK